jgi:hypothetical protein
VLEFKEINALVENPQVRGDEAAAVRLHDLLVQLTREHRLIATYTPKDPSKIPGNTNSVPAKKLPKGIPHGHAFGVLGYDATRCIVQVFNPWGNEVKPAGPPGLEFGYPTHHGMFEVPVREFIQIFPSLHYETEKPLQKL